MFSFLKDAILLVDTLWFTEGFILEKRALVKLFEGRSSPVEKSLIAYTQHLKFFRIYFFYDQSLK